ncbi:DUF3883 domain-containing protein [Alphaproteobacteria bacterium]|nr:DUF3883 domain-containing protein [Alphaproteobacteria bacterium]
MTYNHRNQYRAVIVRGKALSDLDDLLMLYANIISDIVPCKYDVFAKNFNSQLLSKLTGVKTKTLNNHRTEIAGKLFGLYYQEGEDIKISEKTERLLLNRDQPAFFKELVTKYQFPSGMTKINKTAEMLSHGVGVRQFAFFLKVLTLLEDKSIFINKKQAGYYIFNSLDVLTKKATPKEVVNQIQIDIDNNVYREVKTPGKALSFDMQHINEQLHLLILANVILLDGDIIQLNNKERNFIDEFANKSMGEPLFDFSKYDLENLDDRKKAEQNWDKYFASDSDLDPRLFITTLGSLLHKTTSTPGKGFVYPTSTKVLGDEGEEYVYEYEVSRVSKTNPHLASMVSSVGHIKGLGYDISSVMAGPNNPTNKIYIEVKSTKRVTIPSVFDDSINLTKNEWKAAEKYEEAFFIYRVYFTRGGPKIFSIQNPYQKFKTDEIEVIPITYRVGFKVDPGTFLS